MEGPSLQAAEQAFRKHSGGGDAMGLFACKCAVVDLLGLDLGKRALAAALREGCPGALDSGTLSLRQFLAVFSVLKDSQPAAAGLRAAYDTLDPTGRGYITEADFMAVLSSVAPRIASERGTELYKSGDTYDVGKVRWCVCMLYV